MSSKFSRGCFSPPTDYLEVGLKQSSERRKKFASGLDLFAQRRKEENPRERGLVQSRDHGVQMCSKPAGVNTLPRPDGGQSSEWQRVAASAAGAP